MVPGTLLRWSFNLHESVEPKQEEGVQEQTLGGLKTVNGVRI
jgi:hypothetical protein